MKINQNEREKNKGCYFATGVKRFLDGSLIFIQAAFNESQSGKTSTWREQQN